METKLNYLHQKLDVELGTYKLTDAYEEAIRYPFRVGAAKAVVGVIANPCAKSPLIISVSRIFLIFPTIIIVSSEFLNFRLLEIKIKNLVRFQNLSNVSTLEKGGLKINNTTIRIPK